MTFPALEARDSAPRSRGREFAFVREIALRLSVGPAGLIPSSNRCVIVQRGPHHQSHDIHTNYTSVNGAYECSQI